jgi:uncharacterized membrane protein
VHILVLLLFIGGVRFLVTIFRFITISSYTNLSVFGTFLS